MAALPFYDLKPPDYWVLKRKDAKLERGLLPSIGATKQLGEKKRIIHCRKLFVAGKCIKKVRFTVVRRKAIIRPATQPQPLEGKNHTSRPTWGLPNFRPGGLLFFFPNSKSKSVASSKKKLGRVNRIYWGIIGFLGTGFLEIGGSANDAR